EIEAARTHLAAMEKSRQAAAAIATNEVRESSHLESPLHAARVEASEIAAASREYQQQPGTNPGGLVPASSGLSELYRHGAVKEAAKAESQIDVTKSVRALLDTGLTQQLQLNDGQAATLKQLLTQRAAIMWEQMLIPLLTGELDEAGMVLEGTAIKQAI